MEFFYSYQTDKGTVRSTNQDSLIVKMLKMGEGQALMAAVCDGVGGLTHGELTSRRVAELLGRWAEYELPGILREPEETGILKKRLVHLVQDINREIYFQNVAYGVSSGTTLTLLLLYGEHYWAAHVGDSRLYQISGKEAVRLTQDHSWVEGEVLAGRMTQEEAEHSPRKNVILKCIGASELLEPQILDGRVSADTIFVLCSDGFWHYVTQMEWKEALAPENNMESRMLGRTLQRLVEQVKVRGEKDNITAIAVKIIK